MMRTLIVEEHPVFRNTLQRICSSELQHLQVIEAENGAAAIRRLQAHAFTLLVIDPELPDMDGFSLTDEALRLIPNLRILVVTSRCDDYTVYRAEKRRVCGFVDKRCANTTDLAAAIARVACGGVYFSASFLHTKSVRIADAMSFDKILSDRELSVLTLIAVPFTDREIAAELGISVETVEKHRFNVLRKTGATTTAELIRFARARGLTRNLHHIQGPPVAAIRG